MGALRADDPSAEQQRVEFVGPQVGKELYENGALALLLVSIGIVAYLAMRFEWRFAVAAIIANLHDVDHHPRLLRAVPVGVLAAGARRGARGARLLGERVGRHRRPDPRELPQDAQGDRDARDRQRDHEHDLAHDHHPRLHAADGAVDLFFGGETLHYFALALTIGICFGIYSSVLVMAPLVMWMGVSRKDLVKPERKRDGPRARRSCPRKVGRDDFPALPVTSCRPPFRKSRR
jgi:preprotein translocase subunit SecF